MTIIAAIDVGSNAMRLVIAESRRDTSPVIVESTREAVRLGADVFTLGRISEETMARAVAAFVNFRNRLDAHRVEILRAVGTSALREARNRRELIDAVRDAAQIPLVAISGVEEARLIHAAVATRIEFGKKPALLIDIGGGSVEICVADNSGISISESFKMGTVRLLELLGQQQGEKRFQLLLGEYIAATKRRIRQELGRRKLAFAVGTGGNIEALGALRVQMLGANDASIVYRHELAELAARLQALSFEERIRKLNLRPDRADVIVPAVVVLLTIMEQTGVEILHVPCVGLKDGILLDLNNRLYGRGSTQHRAEVLASARGLGEKYHYDAAHAATVARHAGVLFDATRDLHQLGDEYRLLLEVAALLHDIGLFVNVNGHHKHSYYLIHSSPLIGLDETAKAIVANVARYHRKSMPKMQHEGFRELSDAQQEVVRKLSVLLRIANAMDVEHASKVTDFTLAQNNGRTDITLRGNDDLLLEQWAILKQARSFEKVFNRQLNVVIAT